MNKAIKIRDTKQGFSWSINNKPLPINEEKKKYIPIGNRHTIFLEDLFTNYFLLNLSNLGIHKTVFVNFKTTKKYSFSLQRNGNRKFAFDVIFGRGTEKWGKGNVRNLEKYFEGYSEDQILEFNIMIHKASANKYYVELDVSENPITLYTITYLPNGGKNTYVNQIKTGDSCIIPELQNTTIWSVGFWKLKGWNTKSDESGEMYYPLDSITLKEDIILYAIWEDKENLPHFGGIL